MTESGLLPESVVARAFRTCSGEYAWRRSDLESIMQELVDHKLAIISGELWVVEGNLFCSLSPRKDGGWSVLGWTTSERKSGESWHGYTLRSLYETLDAIGSMNVEEEVLPEVHSNLYYHICCADESGTRVFRDPTKSVLDWTQPSLSRAS